MTTTQLRLRRVITSRKIRLEQENVALKSKSALDVAGTLIKICLGMT